MLAYVLIAVTDTDVQKVLDELLSFKEVKQAHILFGEWDMIVELDCPGPEQTGAFVMDNIRNIPGVNLTSTLIVAK